MWVESTEGKNDDNLFCMKNDVKKYLLLFLTCKYISMPSSVFPLFVYILCKGIKEYLK